MPSPSPPRPSPSEAKESNLKQRLLERKERAGGAERNMADSVVTPPVSDRPDPPFQHSIQRGDADGNTSVQSGADVRVTRPLSTRLHHSLPLKPVAAMVAAAAHETLGDDTFSSDDTWRGRELLGSDTHERSRGRRRVDAVEVRPHRLHDYDANAARNTPVGEQPGRGGGVGRSDAQGDWREPPPHALTRAHPHDNASASSMVRARLTSPPLGDSYRPTYDTNTPSWDRNQELPPHDNRGYNSRGPREQRDHRDTIAATGTTLSRHADRDPRPTIRRDLPLPPPPPRMPPFGPTMTVPWEHPNKGGGGNANLTLTGPMNFDQRRQLRESTQVNIWPESPKRPYAEEVKNLESKSRRGKSSKSSSRRKRRYVSDTESDSEEEYERERRRRKRRERERERRRDREYRGDTRDDDVDERRRVDSDDQRERDRKRGRGRRSRRHSSDEEANRPSSPAIVEAADDGPEVGPQLPAEHGTTDRFDREAFRDLLPGEGRAMQAFVEKGQRIPRRGEIGMDMKKIEEFEQSGYVMSGSRHQRMNAVRLRKEGQVINAEEKRAILKQSREEWIEKEGAIISQFKEMMDERLKMEEKRERERDKRNRR